MNDETTLLILGCLGADGRPTISPLFAALPLRNSVQRRALALTRLCERHDLDCVTTSATVIQPHWEFAPEDRAVDLNCTWTALGALHYFSLYGRLLAWDDPDERITLLATTVMFDAGELGRLAKRGSQWEVRSGDDGDLDAGLHRRICERAAALLGPQQTFRNGSRDQMQDRV